MAFNIETFSARFEETGFLQGNKFEVFVYPPPFLSGRSISNNGDRMPTSDIADTLRFRIESIRAPGIQLLFADNVRYGTGVSQKQPYGAQLSEIPISFIVDRYSDLWQFWHNWINGIFQHSGALNAPSSSLPSYKTKYKDDYSTSVEIRIYANDGELVQRIVLYQAFPTAISDVPLSWSEQNQPMRMGVTLTFSQYSIESTAVV